MDDSIKIITCNIRTADADDKGNSWKYRKEITAEVIESMNSDIICFQEMTKKQYSFFVNELDKFVSIAPLEAPGDSNPANAVFYKREKFKFISCGNYWLSSTPHIAGSIDWECQYPRMVNWVRLKINEEEFRVINTHLSHISQKAREKEVQLILDDVSVYPDIYPQILTGDFNCNSKDMPIKKILNGGFSDTYQIIHGVLEPETTIHYFQGDKTENIEGKIDWIFVKGKIGVIDTKIIKDTINGKYPSDHYFISATIKIN